MRFVIYMILAGTMLVPGTLEWHSSLGLCGRIMTHHFFHGNWMHLAVNCLSVWYIFRRWSAREIILAWMIASGSYLLSPVPAIGFSNMIFATIGLRTPPFDSSWWRSPSVIIFIAMTLLMCLLPNVSSVTHIASFVFGTIFSGIIRFFRQVHKDGQRYV